MTTRESNVYAYYVSNGLLHKEFAKEADLLALIKEALDMLDAVWTRGKTDDTGGVSDLLVCYNGRYIAIETKAIGGSATAPQRRFIKKVQRAGGKAAVVTTVFEALNLVITGQ